MHKFRDPSVRARLLCMHTQDNGLPLNVGRGLGQVPAVEHPLAHGVTGVRGTPRVFARMRDSRSRLLCAAAWRLQKGCKKGANEVKVNA